MFDLHHLILLIIFWHDLDFFKFQNYVDLARFDVLT